MIAKTAKKWITGVIAVICTAIYCYLTYYSFRYTNRFTLQFQEKAVESGDMPWLHLLTLAAVLILVHFLSVRICRERRKAEYRSRILLIAVMSLTLAGSLFWIFLTDCKPIGDQNAIVECAQHILQGDYKDLDYTAYLGTVRYQIGLTGIFAFLFQITGHAVYQVIQILNAVMIPVIILSGYGILKECFDEVRVRVGYCLLMLFCFPLMFYTTFVYGEILSIACSVLMTWMVCLLLNRKKWYFMLLAACFATIGIWAKGSAWISVIAAVIILVLYALRQKNLLFLLTAVCVIMLPVAANHLLESGMRQVSGYPLDQGIPYSSYLAMGLQDNEEHPGWFNGYNYYIYRSLDCNREKADLASQENIRERIVELSGNREMAKTFFKSKMLSQWNSPDYEYMVMSSYFAKIPGRLVNSFFSGKLFDLVEAVLNEYQWILYVAGLAGAISLFAGKRKFSSLLLFLNVTGGFLFTIFWEAKARYILSYLIWLVLCGAVGLWKLDGLCGTVFRKMRHKTGTAEIGEN